MKSRHIIPFLILGLVSASRGLTEEGRKTGDELMTGLQQELTDLNLEDHDGNRASALKQYIHQVKSALSQDDTRTLGQYLDSYGDYNPSKMALEKIESIKNSIRDESRQKTQEIISELQGILDTARDKVARATEPEELDKILDALSRRRDSMNYQQGCNTNDPTIRSLLSEIGYARQFVTSWQDYLQATNSGNAAQAASFLQNLASQEQGLIPRSKIIARLQFERPSSDEISKLIDAVKSPKDMKVAIAKLSTLQRSFTSFSDSSASEVRDALRSLTRFEKTYREFLAGLPVNIESLAQSTDSSELIRDLQFIQLRADLIDLILPGTLDLPDDLKPAVNEKMEHFLNRAMELTIARADTTACRRIEKAIHILVGAGTFTEADQMALKCYETGLSQAAAGQPLIAVLSFQNVLKTGSRMIPAEKVGVILSNLQKEHPEEFAEAMKRFQPVPEP